jgi:charged multivesicular body protein 1
MGSGLEQQLFTMKFASKQMARTAKKCEREEHQQLSAVKKAIEKGNADMARIYATNAIRKKNEALNYMRMSARFDAVASQLQSAHMAGMVSNTMAQAVAGLEKALRTENVEQISMMMGKFESQCGMLDTQNVYMDEAMGATARLNTPAHEVDSLIQQVADAHGLEVNMALHSEGSTVPTASPSLAARATADQEQELTRRLNALRDN